MPDVNEDPVRSEPVGLHVARLFNSVSRLLLDSSGKNTLTLVKKSCIKVLKRCNSI